MDFRLSNAYVRGLQQFEIEKFDLRVLGLSLNFDFFFKQIVIEGQHSTRANLGIIGVSGAGPIVLAFNDFRVNGTVDLNTINKGYLNINEFILNLTVRSVNANLRGFGTILDPTISAIISATLPSVINETNARINDGISNGIVPALNELLNQYRLDELIIALITSIINRGGSNLNTENLIESLSDFVH